MKNKNNNFIKITQIRSSIGCIKKHRYTIHCLGLKHIRHTIKVKDNPAIRGMLNSVSYLVKIEN